MDLHALAAVVDDELARGRRLSMPPSSSAQYTQVQPNKLAAAAISDSEKMGQTKIDIMDLPKVPVRKRAPMSDKEKQGCSPEKHKGEDAASVTSTSTSKPKDKGGTYKDYRSATEEELDDPASLIYASASAKESPFPAKLHRILSTPEFQDVIAWLPHGRSWRVLKPKAFEERVVPLFFRHCRYSSFMRQVNGWGFQRVHQGPDVNSYYNELFLRGMPHLSLKMRRPSMKEVKARDADGRRQDAPDFYKISEKNPLPEYDFSKKASDSQEDDTGDKAKKRVGSGSGSNHDAEDASLAPNSAAQQQGKQQDKSRQGGPEVSAAPSQLFGLAALQEKQRIAQQLLSAAKGSSTAHNPLAAAAVFGGNVASALTTQEQIGTVQLGAAQLQPPTHQQIGGNVALLQLLAARQEQQQIQQQAQQLVQQQQQLSLATNMAGMNSSGGEVNQLKAALAASQLHNQIMVAALIAKQSQS